MPRISNPSLKKRQKRRKILYNLFDITLFLNKQHLACRIFQEYGSSLNKGNFVETVELLSKYDPVLKEHFTRNIKLVVPHIPENQNGGADHLSRNFSHETEWMLDPAILKEISKIFLTRS